MKKCEKCEKCEIEKPISAYLNTKDQTCKSCREFLSLNWLKKPVGTIDVEVGNRFHNQSDIVGAEIMTIQDSQAPETKIVTIRFPEEALGLFCSNQQCDCRADYIKPAPNFDDHPYYIDLRYW